MYTHIKSVQILISLLKQYNIHHVVLSPGTRNTALAGSIETDEFFTCYSTVDERSAGFLALGLSETLDAPVCVSCTAATATSNYLPAMKEAYERNIQVIALTADQNPYEMFHMEDQCIDQVDMYHGYVKCAVDVPKMLNEADEWYCNRRINEALLALNHHGKGPVQINYHMSYDLSTISTFDIKELPVTRKIERFDENVDYNALERVLKSKGRILIVGGSDYCGSDRLRSAVLEFSRKHNCAVVADNYANIYDSDEVVLNPKALGDVITPDQVTYLAPELIISFGAVYYSTIKYFLPKYMTQAEHWQIAVDGMVNDGYHCLTKIFECRPEVFFEQINAVSVGSNNGEYHGLWKRRMDMMHDEPMEFTNLSVIKTFCALLPEDSLLHTTVLDSIRMSNYATMHPSVRCFANIGADGIDGALSAYLGQLEDEKSNAYLLIGDLSLMYDMNALLQDIPRNARILVINNFAGAEFHKNFGLERIPTLNKHIAAGHHVKIEECCIKSHFKYMSAGNMVELKEKLERFFKNGGSPMLLEVFTDADKDAKALMHYWTSNREEIPGVKLSLEGRIKSTLRPILRMIRR